VANKFNPQIRSHNLVWIIEHAKYLHDYAITTNNSSLVLYCCLELRNAIEILELKLLLASVNEDEREGIITLSKPKNGINKANNELKTLKSKFQDFYESVCKITGQTGVYFDYNKCEDMKHKLSQYIHTYTREEYEMYFDSTFIQEAFPLIYEVIRFLEYSLLYDGETYTIQCLSKHLEPEDMALLEEWKQGKVKSKEELIDRLKLNIQLRNQTYNLIN
jgi:hypothetical protein